MADVVDLDAYRDQLEAEKPVWRVCKGKCKDCGAEAVSVQHQECPLDNTECPKFGTWGFCVTHFEVDGELVPRLGIVPND